MVKQKFIQFFDVNTTPDYYSVFTVKAGGDLVHKRLAPFFQAYKYYKLGKVTVKCVPASTLPVDPTGLSYEAGENTVDPRDQFNPGLVRITNGEAVNTDLALGGLNAYYATMLDPRWYKFRLQSGFSRSAVPLVWNVAQNRQCMYPDMFIRTNDEGEIIQVDSLADPSASNDVTQQSVRFNSSDTSFVSRTMSLYDNKTNKNLVASTYNSLSGPWIEGFKVKGPTAANTLGNNELYVDVPSGSSFPDNTMVGKPAYLVDLPDTYSMQNSRVRLGWMPTDYNGFSAVPEVDLMTFVLPKAFKTKYYYRIFIETTVFFKDAVVIDPFETGVPVSPIDRSNITYRIDQQSNTFTPNENFPGLPDPESD